MVTESPSGAEIGLRPDEMGRTKPAFRTLRELQTASGSSFQSFGHLRDEILGQIARLQDLWARACEPTSLEKRADNERSVDDSALGELLDETRRLFAGSRVEIGAFGEVKKGKSCLVNGLVGRTVTAVAAPPETAVPVVIEHSKHDRGILHLTEGEVESVSIEEALSEMTQRGQRKRAKSGKPAVLKVAIGTPSSWLPANVVLVDTPGLNDPNIDTDYDKFALAELDRVNAAIFVFCYPNGPGAQEIKLLRSLGQHGVDKVFLAYNFWPDAWSDERTRAELVNYLRELVGEAPGRQSLVNAEDVRVYPMNLKQVSNWLESGNDQQLTGSGFLELRNDLERFLAEGVLSRSLVGASRRLIGVSEMINQTLEGRIRLINDPVAIKDLKRDLEEMMVRSERKLVDIRNHAQTALENLASNLRDLVREPFDTALVQATNTRERAALQAVSPRLIQDANTALSRVSTTWSSGLLKIVSDCRSRLAESLAVEGWGFTGSADHLERLSLEGLSEVSVLDRAEPLDYSAKAAVAGGLVGAFIAATGAGLSIATGGLAAPLIGLLFGASAGGFMGNIFSEPGRGIETTAQEFNDLVSTIRAQQSRVIGDVDRMVQQGRSELLAALTEARQRAVSDIQSELSEVNRVLGDTKMKTAALETIEGLRLDLGKIVG